MEDDSLEDISENDKKKNIISPDVYLREAKHRFAFAANAYPYEFKVLMEKKKDIINEFIHYKELISDAAFFNFAWYRTIMECLPYSRGDNAFCLMLTQICGSLSDAAYIGAKSRNFKKGQEFFEKICRARGAMSDHEYYDAFKKAENEEEKEKRKKSGKSGKSKMKKCKRCKQVFAGKHYCYNRQVTYENASINNQNSNNRRRSFSGKNQTNNSPSTNNNN